MESLNWFNTIIQVSEVNNSISWGTVLNIIFTAIIAIFTAITFYYVKVSSSKKRKLNISLIYSDKYIHDLHEKRWLYRIYFGVTNYSNVNIILTKICIKTLKNTEINIHGLSFENKNNEECINPHGFSIKYNFSIFEKELKKQDKFNICIEDILGKEHKKTFNTNYILENAYDIEKEKENKSNQ